jgi:hypothetical protein
MTTARGAMRKMVRVLSVVTFVAAVANQLFGSVTIWTGSEDLVDDDDGGGNSGGSSSSSSNVTSRMTGRRPTLILHVGPPKSGTTTLEYGLRHVRTDLEEHDGVWYGDVRHDRFARRIATSVKSCS